MNATNPFRIDSARVILRPFCSTDVQSFLAYRNDPEVARYQGWESCDHATAMAFIRDQSTQQHCVPGVWSQIAVELRATGAHIGDCALRVTRTDPRQAEIGFTFARAHQGAGLATEAVSTLITYTFGVVRLHRVFALTDCRNSRAIALLERLGMRREGHFQQSEWFKGEWADNYVYAVLQTEWANRQRPGGS